MTAHPLYFCNTISAYSNCAVGLQPDRNIAVGLEPDRNIAVGLEPDRNIAVGLEPDRIHYSWLRTRSYTLQLA